MNQLDILTLPNIVLDTTKTINRVAICYHVVLNIIGDGLASILCVAMRGL